MAKKLCALLLCAALVLVLLAETRAYSEGLPSTHLQQGNLQMHGITHGSLRPQECGPRCTARCSATSYKKPCMFFCQKCCAKCLCVPPGTYGNKQVCPCYNNWKTKRGGSKCP
ncbi:Protein gast1 [Ancistrocladus abbreviatus]